MAKKQPAQKAARENTPLVFLLLILIPLFGGYYNFSVLLTGAVLAPLLLYTCLRSGQLLLPVSAPAWCLYGLWVCYLVTIPFAVSVGMAFTGFLRVTVWILFFLYASTYSSEERRSILDTVAYEGAILSLFSIIDFLYSTANGVVDLNGRIDGPFQYANTWALYQLICLILLVGKKRLRIDWIAMPVLLCGIYLSGSRSTFLLTLLIGAGYGLWLLIKQRKVLPVLAGTAGVAGIGALSVLLSGGMVWARLQAITLSSSSLNGRLLYAQDGLKMLLSHPLGLGRGGYLYTQPLEQTGVYVLRFIHNEYLQASLDAGLPAGILLAGMVLFLLQKGIPTRERLVVFSIAAHAFIDFDFQFSAIVFLLLLCGVGGKQRSILLKQTLSVKALCGLLTLVMTFGGLVYTMDFLGHTDTAYRLYPWDLELAERQLQSFSTVEEAQPVADRIIASTDLSMLAWDCKFAAAAQQFDTAEMVRTKYQYLRLNRYRGEVYQDFTLLLENACQQATPEELSEYKTLAEAATKQLEEVTQTTSDLAYRIADKPELDFSAEILQRLSNIAKKG